MADESRVRGPGDPLGIRVAFLGYGKVGTAIASAVARAGHAVALATNPDRPAGAAEVVTRHPVLSNATVGPAAEAVRDADIVVLAVPFASLEELVTPLAPALTGKILIDATNPVGPGMTHGLGSSESGAQLVARLAPGAHVVKAFNVYGFENLDQPPTGPNGLRPTMPIAGDHDRAKASVADLLDHLGWEPLDVGPLSAAVDLEHMTLLWVRLVRVLGHRPRLVWAMLGDDQNTPS